MNGCANQIIDRAIVLGTSLSLADRLMPSKQTQIILLLAAQTWYTNLQQTDRHAIQRSIYQVQDPAPLSRHQTRREYRLRPSDLTRE
jgi:hypothetical protein